MPVNRNIWILNHYAITPDMSGGTRHFDLSRELVKKGYEVTIFASGFDHSTKQYIKSTPNEHYRIETYAGVRFIWVNTTPYYRNDMRRVLNMISYGTRVLSAGHNLKKPDIIIGSSMHPFAVLAGWWLSRRYKAKFIFEVRDLWPQTAVDMGAMRSTNIAAKLLYSWEKFMYKKADKIIVLLPNVKEYIEKRGLDSEKVIWIPNGVDLDGFDNPASLDLSSEVTKIFRRYADKFKLVYMGAHGIPNGLDTIIDAAAVVEKKDPNIQFILIGEGTEKERLKSKAITLALNNITFYRAIPKKAVPIVLSLADCLIISIPNFDIYKYGVSLNKFFDYFASKKPIVLAGNPINNIVQEANAGITVEPGNPELLAKAILNMHQMSPEERQQFGVNGRKYVEKHHSTRVLGEKLSQVIDEILKNNYQK